jgi:hypothetical protein
VIDFVGDGVPLANQELRFRHGVRVTKVQILAKGKQAVIAGTHPDTRSAYVWDSEIGSLGDVPNLSLDSYNQLLEEFIEDVGELGWTLDKPVATLVSAVSATIGVKTSSPVSPAPSASSASSANITLKQASFTAARALLAQIPNRDILPNITRSPIDDWLDAYENWVSVAYALVGFLGLYATDPEAEQIWCEWSDGRAQPKQSSISVWRSALGQPTRYQSLGLIKIVRSLAQETPDFPDLDPNDPALQTKTPIWDELHARWAFCAEQSGGFVDMKNRVVLKRQAFSDKLAHLGPALKREIWPARRGQVSVADLFLHQTDRLEVKNVTYAPGDPALVPTGDKPLFNNWRGTAALNQSVSASQIKPWLDHLLFVLGSVAERDRFVRWCVFVVRHPEKKPNWHYLVMSLQGFGKDTMTSPIKLAVGADNWCEELIYSLKGSFDYVIEHKLLIVGETAQPREGFTKSHDMSTLLKPLLARPPDSLPINKKFLAPYYIPNRLAVILFSNEEIPLQLERGQRRIHVVNRRAQKVETLDYYLGLNAWLEGGGAELAASYLLNSTLTPAECNEFIGGVAPESDDKAELEQLNVHPQLAALHDLINDAREGLKDGVPVTLVANADELTQMIRDKGVKPPTPQQTAAWLLNMEREKTGVRRLRIDPKTPHQCGVVNAGGYSGRLWLLADAAPDGRLWSAMTTAEIIALWKKLPPPQNAKILQFPDDDEGRV